MSRPGTGLNLSLELLAERVGDPAPAIYTALFERFPETRDLFVMDTDGGVRGAMLQNAIECLMDLFGDGMRAEVQIRAEHSNHDGYGVAPDVFPVFFQLIRDAAMAAAGDNWTQAMETDWRSALDRIDRLIAAPV
ncbi:MAG: globin [Pseudomonadota bacterium]